MNYIAGIFVVHIDVGPLHGFQAFALLIGSVEDFCLTYGEFISFPAHIFYKDGEMQLAPAGNLEALGRLRFLHAKAYVGIQLPEETVPQMAGGYILAFFAC